MTGDATRAGGGVVCALLTLFLLAGCAGDVLVGGTSGTADDAVLVGGTSERVRVVEEPGSWEGFLLNGYVMLGVSLTTLIALTAAGGYLIVRRHRGRTS